MEEKSYKKKFSQVMDSIDSAVSVVCVLLLFVMTVAALVMVIGRYAFEYVPRGTEQLAVMCMVWFSMVSISLSIRDDTIIKMELIDVILPKKRIRDFKILAGVINVLFAVSMIKYGMDMTALAWPTRMSGLQIPQGVLNLSVPVGGLTMLVASVAQIIEILWNREKKGGVVDDA